MSVVPENARTRPTGAKWWCFTWFFPEGVCPLRGMGGAGGDGGPLRIKDFTSANCEGEYNWPKVSAGTLSEIAGMAWQIELCPTTGRAHVQGYVEMHATTRFERIKAILNMPSAHMAERQKSRKHAIDYVTKEETREENTFPVLIGLCHDQDTKNYKSRQGARTDIQGMVDLIKSGKRTIEQLDADADTFVKFSRGFADVRRIIQQSQAKRIRTELEVVVYWGAAGSGKTRAVYDKHGVENVFTLIADNSACWFDGYEGEDVLLIDDFKGWVTYSMLLKILDIYPLRCPVKNSFTYAKWTKVYITSNYDPATWYSGAGIDYNALKRRFTSVKEFGAIHAAMRAGSEGGAGAGGEAPSSLAYGFTPLTRQNAFCHPSPARLQYTSDTEEDSDNDQDE